MNHPDKYLAKRYDTPNRSRAFTDAVYCKADATGADLNAAWRSLDPPAPELIPLVGEMHGHTNLSDGRPDIDTYFRNIRDLARLDFAVLTDHDHGGVGRPALWEGSPSKWDLIRAKAREYCEPGKFSTLLGYERDSYPFYSRREPNSHGFARQISAPAAEKMLAISYIASHFLFASAKYLLAQNCAAPSGVEFFDGFCQSESKQDTHLARRDLA